MHGESTGRPDEGQGKRKIGAGQQGAKKQSPLSIGGGGGAWWERKVGEGGGELLGCTGKKIVGGG